MSDRALIGIAAAALGGGCVIGNNTEASPVQFEAGLPVAVDFLPGQVVYEVCVAVDVDDGYVRPVALTTLDAIGVEDGIGPQAGAEVQPQPIDGLGCPEVGYQGWARIIWHTSLARGTAIFVHSNAPLPVSTGDLVAGAPQGGSAEPDAGLEAPAPSAASAGEIVLRGERFGGYDVTSGELGFAGTGIITVPVDIEYRSVGALAGRPANDITLALTYAPVPLPLFGSSSVGGDLRTDFDGHIELLYSEASVPCTADVAEYAVFVTPFEGGIALAASLPCTPEPSKLKPPETQ